MIHTISTDFLTRPHTHYPLIPVLLSFTARTHHHHHATKTMQAPHPTNPKQTPILTRLSQTSSRIQHGISTWSSECRAFNTQFSLEVALEEFIEACKGTTGEKDVVAGDEGHGLEEAGWVMLEGIDGEGDGDGGGMWRVCGCKGCEDWDTKWIDV
jgi:hypothetical protein